MKPGLRPLRIAVLLAVSLAAIATALLIGQFKADMARAYARVGTGSRMIEPGAQAAAGRIPKSRLVVFKDGGHLWIGHQRELWCAVEDFLHGRPASAGGVDPRS